MLTERPVFQEMVRFAADYTFYLNLAFGAVAAWLLHLHFTDGHSKQGQ